jgi:hypothetical protein
LLHFRAGKVGMRRIVWGTAAVVAGAIVVAVGYLAATFYGVGGLTVTNERQVEVVFERHRAWFDHAVQQVAKSRIIESIPLPEDFFDEGNKAKLAPEDQKIYLDLQAGMQRANVRRIVVVGSDIKEAVAFIMDNGPVTPGGIKVLAISPGYSLEMFLSPYQKCRPLVEPRWYVCRVDA